MYGVYDTKNNDICVGILTIEELTDFIGLTKESIYTMMSQKKLMKKRYSVVSFRWEELQDD